MTVLAVFVGALLAGWALMGVLAALSELVIFNLTIEELQGRWYALALCCFLLVGAVLGPFLLAEIIARQEYERDKQDPR